MTNICIIIRSLAHGGAEKQSLMLTKALGDFANPHLVILDEQPQHEKHLQYIEAEGLNHSFLQGSIWKKLQVFRAFLREHKIEMIFTYLPSDTLFGALAGRLENIPHILGGIRNAELGWGKRKVLQWVHKYWLEYAISNSYVGKENFINYGYNARKLLVLPNGLELEQGPIQRTPKDPVRIISVGRYVGQKDYETALKAFQFLQREICPDHKLQLQLIGFGELESQIRAWLIQYELEDSVELIISPPNLGDYYAGADIYLCTSLVEGLSNSVMEAMSYSLPVVATDAGDNKQLVRVGENGFICPIKDYRSLATALSRLVQSSEKRSSYGKNSYGIIQQEYTFDAFQRNYQNLIDSLLVGASPLEKI